MVAAAIFAMLMELVLEAKIALGDNSLPKVAKMDCFNARFSETACSNQSVCNVVVLYNTDLYDHIGVTEASDIINGGYSGSSIICLVAGDPAFGYVLFQKFVNERKAFRYLVLRPVVQQDWYFSA